ncbi:MAG: hypothetical protein QME81_15715 [bacterium]|nr:hypothetical protein [bacterium]
MGDFDITLKRLSDEFTVDYARFALDDERINLVGKIDVSKIEKELPILTREADCLARVAEKKGKEFILHIDFQAEYRHNLPDRMLGYTYRVYEKYKLPVYSVLIVLKETGVKIRTKTEIKVRDLKSLRHEYKVIKVWEVEAEKILEKKITGLYPLLPLMKTDKSGEELISEAAELIEKEVEDIEHKADAYVALRIFSAINFPSSLVNKILKRRDIMVQSPAYQEILQEGEMIGIGKGKVLGIEEGIERSILEVLEERFGFISPKLEQEVRGLQGMKACDFLLRKAINVPSIEEFKELLERVKQEV